MQYGGLSVIVVILRMLFFHNVIRLSALVYAVLYCCAGTAIGAWCRGIGEHRWVSVPLLSPLPPLGTEERLGLNGLRIGCRESAVERVDEVVCFVEIGA